ncbi:MAG: tyrosine-protein phosphatase [Gammaproteobacteria bacterium]|nr:tyrosine-protein phosphatase [Gammaproteobacteria bacterium]
MDPLLATAVEQPEPGRYVLTWDDRFTASAVTVRAATTAAAAPDGVVVAEGARGGAEIVVDDPARRWYFHLLADDGAALVVAERGVPFAGAVNFRDIGGYATADGRRLPWGRLYRSGHMTHLTESDKALFATLGIATVIDFRMELERAAELTELPGAPALHVLGVPPGVGTKDFLDDVFASAEGPEPVVDAMHAILRGLVRECAPYYARLFERLLEAPAGAVLLNCSAGKERTGVGVALLLAALGVPLETIRYDFMLSARYFPAEQEVPRVIEKYNVQRGEASRAIIWPLLEARASYLEVVLEAIEEDCGSMTAFLESKLGLGEAERARLVAAYTV